MITNKEKEIIEKLKHCLGYDAPLISQEQFDNMVDYIMKNETIGGNPKELIWRLCGCYEGFSFNKVVDIFVDTRDSYYTSELVSYVDGNLNQKYLINKMMETNDLKYIYNAMINCGHAMMDSLEKENAKILSDFYNNTVEKNNTESSE